MDIIERIITFIPLSLLIIAIPGPTSLYVLSQGLNHDRKKPFAAIAGVALANLTWFFLCGLGVATVVRDSHATFAVLRLVGTIYLIYLSISTLKNSKRTSEPLTTEGALSLAGTFGKGFLTSMSNPKAALFYLSFLPQFVSKKSAYHLEIMAWGLGYVSLVILVMSIYGFLAFRINRIIHHKTGIGIAKKALGCGFLGSAIALWKFEQA